MLSLANKPIMVSAIMLRAVNMAPGDYLFYVYDSIQPELPPPQKKRVF